MHWLLWAYLLEFRGLAWCRPVVWGASLVFLATNVQLMRALLPPRGRAEGSKAKGS